MKGRGFSGLPWIVLHQLDGQRCLQTPHLPSCLGWKLLLTTNFYRFLVQII